MGRGFLKPPTWQPPDTDDSKVVNDLFCIPEIPSKLRFTYCYMIYMSSSGFLLLASQMLPAAPVPISWSSRSGRMCGSRRQAQAFKWADGAASTGTTAAHRDVLNWRGAGNLHGHQGRISEYNVPFWAVKHPHKIPMTHFTPGWKWWCNIFEALLNLIEETSEIMNGEGGCMASCVFSECRPRNSWIIAAIAVIPGYVEIHPPIWCSHFQLRLIPLAALQHGVRRTFFWRHLVPLRRRAGSGGQDYTGLVREGRSASRFVQGARHKPQDEWVDSGWFFGGSVSRNGVPAWVS